ncbi:MOSC domain-containing protein [Rhodococcus sp. SGAir0479]|uniref:MOSC domain-containing protein n=1 Tax=Rhodococcus sp. SGAir0479 TaxID=2567884 RepID=UPI0010CCF82B|nr:MOSC domain-containing protein [Rhodococcus sp. SGAir0479]QCQ89805.1 MOSC domain-containing protein [Rhodococcus sp. SGAir0479]
MTARVEAVCVVFAERDTPSRRAPRTAIDKRPVTGPVRVETAGLTGDHVCDTKFHGGRDKAVYAYSAAEARRWADELGRELPVGWFGENLRVSGVATTDAVIGTRWRIGTTELEVTEPRVPCGTFAHWSGEPQWVKRFTARADVGAYLRVLVPGHLQAGDPVELLTVPAHGVTVRDVFTGAHPGRLRALLAGQPDLARDAQARVRKFLNRLEEQVPT